MVLGRLDGCIYMHRLDMEIEFGFYEERCMNMCLRTVLQNLYRIHADVNTKMSPHDPSRHDERLFPHTNSAFTALPQADQLEWHDRGTQKEI